MGSPLAGVQTQDAQRDLPTAQYRFGSGKSFILKKGPGANPPTFWVRTFSLSQSMMIDVHVNVFKGVC